MDKTIFRNIIEKNENDCLDFKIKCKAFESKEIGPKAELAKDICAMANNGNKTSYIVIGVSDDKRNYLSISNMKLTEENLQDFCKTAIYPVPTVKLFRDKYLKSSSRFSNTEFAVIQIGPHAKQAFRLARDFINHDEKVSFRKNEVWIRRGRISDLATPEEIVNLSRKNARLHIEKSGHNVDYYRLPMKEKYNAIMKDLKILISEHQGKFLKHDFILKLFEETFVFNIRVADKFGKDLLDYYLRGRAFGHIILVVSVNNVSRGSFSSYSDVLFKENWGWFSNFEIHGGQSAYNYFGIFVPLQNNYMPFTVICLSNVRSSDHLRRSFLSLINYLNSDINVQNNLQESRDIINSQLFEWLKLPKKFATFHNIRDQGTKLSLISSAKRVLKYSMSDTVKSLSKNTIA